MKKYIFCCIIACMSIIAVHAQRAPKVNDTTYMLTYDHGGLILWGDDHFQERLRNAIDWLNKYPSFKIGLENEAQIYDYFAEHNVALLNEIRQYLQQYKGRFGIGSCTYGQPLSVFISDESNIRQIYYALDTEKRLFNYQPPVYLMSEHAMHSQIPQIINGFGFKGAIMRTHYMMYGYNPVFNFPIGLWVGIDGSKISTVPTYVGEGAAFGKTTVDTWILTRYPSAESKESLDDYRKQFKNINPLLATRADDSGLRREELVKEYEGKKKFQWILLDDLMSKYPPAKDLMPTKPNDFTVRMPWGYCGNEIWNASRKAEVSVLTAERLSALARIYRSDTHEAELDKAWKDLLLAQHHDVQIVGLLPEARKLLPESYRNSSNVTNACMEFFGGKMKGEGFKQITVFNPLSWKHSEWITAYVSFYKGDAKNLAVKCGNNTYPVRIIQSNDYSDGSILDAYIAFNAPLDPLSLTTFSVVAADATPSNSNNKFSIDEKNLLIKTPFYEIKLGAQGGIEYLKNAQNEYLLQNQGNRGAFFEGTIDKVVCTSAGKWTIHKSPGNAPWVKITENGFIADIPYTLDITFYEDKSIIDCKASFAFDGQKIGLPTENLRDSHSPFVHDQKLRFKLFPSIEQTAIGIRDLPFAIAETPDKNIEGNYWTALSDGKNGLAIFNKGIMGSIREQDNSLSIPLAYSMYYVWGTRALYGNYEYEFALYPFKGNWHNADLSKRALEYSFQAPSIETKRTTQELANKIDVIQFQADNDLILTALYPQKGSVVARFFKQSEDTKSSNLNIRVDSYKLSEVDLGGNLLNKDISSLQFTPWQFKTIRLDKK